MMQCLKFLLSVTVSGLHSVMISIIRKDWFNDAGYLQPGHTWVKSRIACHMSENRQVVLSICVCGRVMGKWKGYWQWWFSIFFTGGAKGGPVFNQRGTLKNGNKWYLNLKYFWYTVYTKFSFTLKSYKRSGSPSSSSSALSIPLYVSKKIYIYWGKKGCNVPSSFHDDY